jgi:multisubunit Na+/H+ antiporter MnhB subunit
MSENEDNRNQFFDVDERRVFPRPLAPPISIGRTNGSGMHNTVKIAIGISSTIALIMVVFGVTVNEVGFLNPGLQIPAYGVALLVLSFSEFHILRYIGDSE